MTDIAAVKPMATLLTAGLDVPGATCCETLAEAAQRLSEVAYEVVLLSQPLQDILAWTALSQAVLDSAVVVVLNHPPSDEEQTALLERGVQDVVVQSDGPAEALRRRMEIGAQRKAIDRRARRALATDLATGLPNHGQLLEHMTHLVALREREPAPMATIALRVEGLATVAARFGLESANVLRRKVAVRLRASLRASDVVASVGDDAFVVLLAWIDSPADGERVARKLVQSLRQPFSVAGADVAIALSAGLALYPEHGKDADALLRRCLGQAAGQAAMGREGFANRVERGAAPAAND